MIYRQTAAGLRLLLPWLLIPSTWIIGVGIIHAVAMYDLAFLAAYPWYEAFCNVLWLAGMILLVLNLRLRMKRP